MHRSGRHFLQIPGPTNTPDRVLRAMAQPTIDHRSAEFAALGRAVLDGLKPIFQTSGAVVIFPASGTGAWEASLVNTLSPGDRVLAFDIGEFSRGWAEVARRLGLDVEIVPGDWRHGVDPAALETRLGEDRDHRIRAVLVVHNETSTGVTSRLPEIRRALDRAGHPALLLVDAVSSLGSIDLRHDDWGLDVTLAGSQKGLMLPPGIELQRHQREGPRRVACRGAAAFLFRVGADAAGQRGGILPVHAGDESSLRPSRGARHARGGRAAERLRAAPAAGGGGARGRGRVGPGDRSARERTSTAPCSRP